MRYSKHGKQQNFDEITGEIRGTFSLSHLLSQWTNFKNQKIYVEQLCEELSQGRGATSPNVFSPKYHSELADKGINDLSDMLPWN